ncbi:MAG: transcriptional regulator [Crocinitomicaceae bacterium]|nr:transcriptional regulator [Crocinitomicaceae bacterium]|tara:strand:- start:20389 stop:20775 length:387 start_codon:yes stop_codon:yes gene_type:complete
MRSDCPVSYALDVFGDKWTFLIIRDLVQGKRFYKDFLNSKEGIATNILSDRLKKLESNGIIESEVYQKLKTKKQYSLTEKGMDLVPILVDLIVWSDKHQAGLAVTDEFISRAKAGREELVMAIREGLG